MARSRDDRGADRASGESAPLGDPFARAASAYQAWYDTPGGRLVYEAERRAVADALPPLPGSRVLDLGAGTGAFARPLIRAGAAVVGVDRSMAMLREAASVEPRPALVQGDAASLPFAGATFDAALAVTMLEFVPEPARAVAEACRVVRPGGRVVVAVLNAHSPWWWMRRGRGVYAQAHAFTAREIRRLLAPHGRVAVRHVVHFPLRPLFLARPLASMDDRMARLPGGAILLATLHLPRRP